MPAGQAGIRKEAPKECVDEGWSGEQSKERRRLRVMSERKENLKQQELNRNPREIGEEFAQAETEMEWKLEALDKLFTRTQDHPEEFHRMYVKPLLEEELSLEMALELLVAGVFRPN